MLEFVWPWMFALLPLPWLIHALLPEVPQQGGVLQVPFIDDFAASHPSQSRRIRVTKRYRIWLALLAWLCLLAAVARPQWVGDAIELPVEGRDIMLAVDLSGSMQETDFILNGRRVDRLTATQAVATAFIRQRTGDRIGLILFGERAYLQTPLTYDRHTVTTLLNEAVVGMAGEKTAIGDAIGLGIKRLREKQGERILILLSDGANSAGVMSPDKAAELAKEDDLKIYTIGIGPDPMNSRGNFFGMMVAGSGRANVDSRTLAMIADKTGGRYFHANNTEKLQQVYEQIDALEPLENERRVYRPVDSLFYWPLALAMWFAIIIVIDMSGLLAGRRRYA